ncbi:MAG: DEAD/DEAH box helicase family protein [Eggerthellaceae bacterium]|nr:DEAD/DEAH box helicase family protein [Eggerthellaceae bacterium]
MSVQIDVSGWDRSSEVGVVSAYCGQGKTYSAVHEMPHALDAAGDTLLLVPRVAIKDQVLSDYRGVAVEYGARSAFGDEPSVEVGTYHKVASDYEAGSVPRPKLVICDEWHTTFAETHFAEQLMAFQRLFVEWVADAEVTVVVMTATDTLPLRFVVNCPYEDASRFYGNRLEGVRFRKISVSKEPLFKVGKIQVEQGKSVANVLRRCAASPQNKQLVFCMGKTESLIRDAEADEGASWLCSDNNRWAEVMNQEHRSAVIDRGMLPEGVNRLYLTSAYREGVNIHDPDVREVIIEAVNDISIVQSLGRVRHDIDRLIVVVDRRKSSYDEKKIRTAIGLLEDGSQEAYENYYLRHQSADDGGKPNLVYKSAQGAYEFNFYALYWWLYSTYSWICAAQTERTETTWLDGKKLPGLKEYFDSMLGKFTGAAIGYNLFSYKRPISVQEENEERIAGFDFAPWAGVELYGDAADEFRNALGLRNKDESIMAMSGIYKNLPDLFEPKRRVRRGGKQVMVYKLK